MAAKPKPTRGTAATWLSPGSPNELGPSEQLAHEILATRSDLQPSLARIMSATLDDISRHRALTLFNAALANPNDPNRDPRNAIANGQVAAGSS